MSRLQAILIIVLMCVFTTYAQVIVKWRTNEAGPMPADWAGRFFFVMKIFLNPWYASVLLAIFLASLCWTVALARLPLNSAYPLTSLTFIMVMIVSSLIFHESISWLRITGVGFIILGLILTCQE